MNNTMEIWTFEPVMPLFREEELIAVPGSVFPEFRADDIISLFVNPPDSGLVFSFKGLLESVEYTVHCLNHVYLTVYGLIVRTLCELKRTAAVFVERAVSPLRLIYLRNCVFLL